jgi:bifunctional non-homologous end joining protein LigD
MAAKKNSDREITVGRRKLLITNTEKVYFPKDKITKGEIVDYYRRIAKYILPYLKDRPQSLNRHVNGIAGPGFYQKDMDTDKIPEWLHTEKLFSKSNDDYIDYLICNDAATLVYMANLGCIEINPWHSVYQQEDNPDYLIMDLDPADIEFIHVVDCANTIRQICEELKVPCHCKTSGSTGLHIYIPMGKKYTYDEIKMFGELLANETHRRLPDTTSVERATAKRKTKIYVDFLQNRKGQTIAAAYSARPKPGATVSTPLMWDEVNHDLNIRDYTIYTIEERLKEKGDLWKGVLRKGIDLEKVMKRMEKMLG